MRVLIVEDDSAVGEVLDTFVRELGHETQLVPSAEAGLERLQRDRPDLVLLDFRLPGISGLEFLQLPLVQASGVPIIVVSGLATESQARECLRSGALDFVPKPIPFDQLQRLLECVEPQTLVPKTGGAWRIV